MIDAQVDVAVKGILLGSRLDGQRGAEVRGLASWLAGQDAGLVQKEHRHEDDGGERGSAAPAARTRPPGRGRHAGGYRGDQGEFRRRGRRQRLSPDGRARDHHAEERGGHGERGGRDDLEGAAHDEPDDESADDCAQLPSARQRQHAGPQRAEQAGSRRNTESDPRDRRRRDGSASGCGLRRTCRGRRNGAAATLSHCRQHRRRMPCTRWSRRLSTP